MKPRSLRPKLVGGPSWARRTKMGPGGQMGCDSLALRFQRGWPNPYSQLFGRSLPGPIDAMLGHPASALRSPRSTDSGHICRRTPTRVNHLRAADRNPSA